MAHHKTDLGILQALTDSELLSRFVARATFCIFSVFARWPGDLPVMLCQGIFLFFARIDQNPGDAYVRLRTHLRDYESCGQGCPMLQPKPVPGKYGESIGTLGIYRDIT